ncbi:MAG TPA: hypothetical protein DCO89_01240 [Clostridiales bacterium]|nr:hypothetical protein [Clostridiales bacterium]
MKNKTKKGFTIVELVIVIAVIGILAAVLIPMFSGLINKAYLAADESMVRNINNQLAIAEVQVGKNPTMHEALLDAQDAGYIVENINAKSRGNLLVWDQTLDRVALIEKETGNVIAGEVSDANNKVALWQTAESYTAGGYSIYLKNGYNGSATISDVNTGIDVGYNENISSISYVSNSSQSVVIRTNGGTLTIDAPADTVKHYGEAQVVNLTAVDTNSFYENGNVDQVNIKTGRLVLTNSAEASVKTVYLQATGESYDNIIIATQSGAELPNLIARDKVTLPTEGNTKKVVTIESNVDRNGKNAEKIEIINLYATVGAIGNDVYEATNGYNVSDLALLVVEASSTEAQEQAAEQISNPEVVAKVCESKTAIEVDSEEKLTNALGNQAKYIIVTDSFNVSKTIEITYNITIDGQNHKITTSADRALWIDENNVNLTITNLTLDSNNKCQRGIQVNTDIKGYNIKLNNVNVLNNTYYAINMCGNTSGTFVATDCNISGWSALNTWGSGHSITFTNCTLTGTNNKSVSASNTYAVLCLEADTTLKTNDYSSFNTVTLNGCTLNAVETNANIQNIVNFNGGNPGSTGNTLITNGCTFNSTNKHAYHDGGAGNSWINNGEEMLVNVVADLSNVTISENGYNATGTVKFTINGKQISYNLSNATKSTWTSNGTTGMDYVFEYNAGILTYSLDLDLWSGYPNGYAIYVSSEFSR